MQLNDQGLPLPGKALDAWIWQHVFNGELAVSVDGDILWFVDVISHPTTTLDLRPIDFRFSTTSAYHLMMEAMRKLGYEWQIDVCTRYVQVQLRKHAGAWDLAVWDEPDIEAAIAEVVCQITWKAEGGEG